MADPIGVKAYSVVDGIEAAQNAAEITEVIERVRRTLPPVKRFMEVGVLHGGSAIRYAHALCAPDATVLLCDIDLPRFQKAARILKDTGYEVHCLHAGPETVAQVHDILTGAPLDLLHIDANHEYPYVKADWLTYSPLVRPGGVVLLHDVCGKEGVIQFWAELKKTQPRTETVRISNGPGIGIVWT